jgi:hypothetical protein
MQENGGDESGGGDVDALVDLIESELGTSSHKQNVSAWSEFNVFLNRHVSAGMKFSKMKVADVTKVMFGQLLPYLLLGQVVAWQKSMNYVSSFCDGVSIAHKLCGSHLSQLTRYQ